MITHAFYPSVAALREAAMQPLKKKLNVARRDAALTSERTSFLGGYTAAQALSMLTTGNPEGEAVIRSFHDRMAASLPRAEGHQRTKRRGAIGDELDIHAVNRGACDRAWSYASRSIKRGSGILRLVIDICANGSTSADSLRWRGIAGLALAEVMSKAGYSVEIVAAFAVSRYDYHNSRNLTCSIVVKPRTSQADLGLLAATVALPAFFRTLGFAAICIEADRNKVSVDSGLGHYLDVSGVLPVPDKVTQLFVDGSVCSEQKAVEWVRQSVVLLQGVSK